MQSWIAVMAAQLKQLDPNHLVGIGEEGFYGPSAGGNRSTEVNPSGTSYPPPPPPSPLAEAHAHVQD